MNRASFFVCVVLVACGDGEPGDSMAGATGAEATSVSSTTGGGDGSAGQAEVRADLGVEPPAICEVSCAVTSACQGVAVPDCLLQCTAELVDAQTVSVTCGAAYEALEACVSGLSCDELAAHDADEEGPCRSAAQQTAVDCEPPGNTPSTVCADLCASLLDCGLSEETPCLASCIELRSAAAASGEPCAAAQDEQLTCVAGLDCPTLGEWVSTGSTPTCTDDLDQACSGDEE